MSDPFLFSSGNLFTTDYLVEAIRSTEEYRTDVEPRYTRIRRILEAFPRDRRPNEAQTEDDLIWPVLEALGWSDILRQQNLTSSGRDDVPDGLLFENADAKAQANSLDREWQRYSLGLAVVECKRWGRPLDRSGRGEEASTPSTQMLRYLRRIDDLTHGRLRWGILTNGIRWRLYWAGARSVSEEFLEIDLSRIFQLDVDLLDAGVSDEEREHWFRIFVAMFSRTSFALGEVDSLSFHQRALHESTFYEQRVARDLSSLVFNSVFPALAREIATHAPEASLHEVRDAALIILYRLLFLLYAEDRQLLPVRDRRFEDYSLRPLRQEIGDRISRNDTFSGTATRIFNHIADLSRMINHGDPSVGLPPYNGGLFSPESSPLLGSIRITDDVMATTLDALSFERSAGTKRYINYRDLSVQQLGSIYERLLEHELVREDDVLTVRLNAFARKNTGSYYTPDPIVGLILDRTLGPLVSQCRIAFTETLESLRSADAEDFRRRQLRRIDSAEAMLSLRILDPAMGSGHFLVSVVDKLADHVLDAMAEVAVEAAELDYRSPLAERIETIRETILANANAAGWAIDEAQLDDRHIVRRMVLKRCIFGVDKNPMAVELAKVSLWLHTFTVGAPLSFIDHHLRTGDSLFGLWVREAIDKAHQWGGGELLYSGALREAQSAASAMQIIERLTDAEIAEAHQSADTFYGVQAQTAPLNAFVSFLHALDWLDIRSREDKAAIRAWLDGLFGNPIDIVQGRAEPALERATRDEGERFAVILEEARGLVADQRFLNWQTAFPGVWTDWSTATLNGGFDAVVGNPPWDRIKLQQVEWFAARRPQIALASRASDRRRMITELEPDDPLAREFALADSRSADMLQMARTSGAFPLLGRGDVNLYSLFVERAHTLVKPTGMVGLLVPIGIGTDNNAARFFSMLAREHNLHAFISFENKGRWLFRDVHSEDQPTVIIFSGGSRQTEVFDYGVKLHMIPRAGDGNITQLTASTLRRVNPNSETAPVFRSSRDLRLVVSIYDRLPVLVDRSGASPVDEWPVRYVNMLHMTNDSGLFRTRSELEEDHAAWGIGQGRFQSRDGVWLPLLEGKSIQIYNHRFASIVTPEGSVSGQGQGVYSTTEQLTDPNYSTSARYYVLEDNVRYMEKSYALAFNDICNTNNKRSVIAAVIPKAAAGNTLPLLINVSAREISYLLANMNSIAYDYVARNKIQSRHLNKYILEQLPIVQRGSYSNRLGSKTIGDIVAETVLELSYNAHDLAPFARDLGYTETGGEVRPPFIWNGERREMLRAKLDALYFMLYGVFDPRDPVQGREDIRHIYSTFGNLEREEVAAWGYYRSRELTLAWLNALSAGQPDAVVTVTSQS